MSMDGRTDGWMEGRTDEPITVVPFDLHRGTIIREVVNVKLPETHLRAYVFLFILKTRQYLDMSVPSSTTALCKYLSIN